MAGIGLRFGMRAFLVTDIRSEMPEADLFVYATDTRSQSLTKAMDETRRAIRQLQKAGCGDIFKKADSVLRGHVVAELESMLAVTGQKRAVYLPENPSKGRIVRDGIYYIDGVPLNETFFARDPEFPAATADLRKRFPEIAAVLSPGDTLGETGIFAANAETEADVESYISLKDPDTVLAGGADFFTAYLRSLGWKERESPPFEGLGSRNALVVCGSTAQHSLTEFDYFKRREVPVVTMPDDVFNLKHDPKMWFIALDEVYELHHSIAVAVGHPVRKGANYAHRLRNIISLAVSSLIDTRLPEELVIEGGSTAFSILRILGWSCFRVTDEIAPGVVRMALAGDPDELDLEPEGIHITLKPGSYSWGDTLFR